VHFPNRYEGTILNRRNFCFLLAAAIFTTPSFARRGRGGRRYNEEDLPPRFRGGGLKRGVKFTGRTMSRAELEQCVLQQEKIDLLEDKIDENKNEISSLESQLKISESKIEREKSLVNSYSQKSVDNFNSLLPAHKKIVTKYNAKLPKFNNLVKQQNSVVNSFNNNCTVHSYYIDDMIYILKKMGLYG